MTIDERTFRRAMGSFATGVSVVTSCVPGSGQPVGMTVNALTSVSLAPPQILVCLSHSAGTLELLTAHGHFAVNILASKQRDLSIRFSRKSDDKWDGVDYAAGEAGVPLLSGCIATLQCRVAQTVNAGDHAIVIGDVLTAEHNLSGAPLLYFRGGYLENS